MELLEVNHLCKTYGSGETAVHALKDVSFSVPKGEYVAVVGESGSGSRGSGGKPVSFLRQYGTKAIPHKVCADCLDFP